MRRKIVKSVELQEVSSFYFHCFPDHTFFRYTFLPKYSVFSVFCFYVGYSTRRSLHSLENYYCWWVLTIQICQDLSWWFPLNCLMSSIEEIGVEWLFFFYLRIIKCWNKVKVSMVFRLQSENQLIRFEKKLCKIADFQNDLVTNIMNFLHLFICNIPPETPAVDISKKNVLWYSHKTLVFFFFLDQQRLSY